jgi:Holliday junction resolvase-like predicted endonuclease
MKRAVFIKQLEERRIRSAAREYAEQGYRVIRHPSRAERPDFLAAFELDLIAFGEPENVVVEVRSRDTLGGDDSLVTLTAAVNAQPGWRIDLLVTNPRKQAIVRKDAVLASRDEAEERLIAARRLLTLEQAEAAFVIAWSALETTLREFGEIGPTPVDYLGTGQLLHDAYSVGPFDLESNDIEMLRVALQERNAIVHGYRASDNLGNLAARVIEIAERLLTVDVAALAS